MRGEKDPHQRRNTTQERPTNKKPSSSTKVQRERTQERAPPHNTAAAAATVSGSRMSPTVSGVRHPYLVPSLVAAVMCVSASLVGWIFTFYDVPIFSTLMVWANGVMLRTSPLVSAQNSVVCALMVTLIVLVTRYARRCHALWKRRFLPGSVNEVLQCPPLVATPIQLQCAYMAQDWKADTAREMTKASHKTVTELSMLVYLAACRIAGWNTTASTEVEAEKTTVMKRVKGEEWSAVADSILDCRSADDEITRIEEFMKAKLDTNIPPGLLELFTRADLCYIVSGTLDITTFEAAEGEALKTINQDMTASTAAFRLRLLRVGLCRYREWRDHQRANTDPYAVEDVKRARIDYNEALDPSDATLATLDKTFVETAQLSSHFVGVWDKVARPTSLETVIMQLKYSYQRHHVLMTASTSKWMGTRKSTADAKLPLVDVLAAEFSDSKMNEVTTLAMSGEAGSGKTQSALALATRADVLCAFMRAEDVEKHLPSVANDVGQPETFAARRNRRWAACIVRELVVIEDTLAHPMKAAPEMRKRLVIVVDEAGAYPELVQAMCSSTFSLRGPAGYTNTTLVEHLKVDRINLVVTGTGVSAMKTQCGSSLQHFHHVIMNRNISTSVIDALEAQYRVDLPCFYSLMALTRDLTKCRVQRQIEVVKQNPRMFSFFVEAVAGSTIFKRIKKDFASGIAVLSTKIADEAQREKCYLLPMYTHCYAELKRCLSLALMRFKDVNGLVTLSYPKMRQAVFNALLFSCLKRDWKGRPAAQLEAQYGILVDMAVLQDAPLTVRDDGKTNADESVCFSEREYTVDTVRRVVRVVVTNEQNHRYAVSPAHTELALSMLGAEDVEWTRLGFERIVTEAVCLHTLIAVHAADTLIALAMTEYFEKWSAVVPALGLGHADGKCKKSVHDRLTEAEAKAKLKLIEHCAVIPPEEKMLLRKLLNGLRGLTKVQLEQTASDRAIEVTADLIQRLNLTETELRNMLGLLLNETARDPLREMKVMRWVHALLLRRKTHLPLAVLKTTLPKERMNFFKPVWVGVGGWKQVVPSGWLLRELDSRVKEQFHRLFEPNNTDLELQVIVVAMMYEDAPGVDAVLAYGTYKWHSQDTGKEPAPAAEKLQPPPIMHFKVDRLVKIQYKKRDSTTVRAPPSKCDQTTTWDENGNPIIVRDDREILSAMGVDIDVSAHTYDGVSASGVSVEHWVVQHYKDVHPSCAHDENHPDAFYCLLNEKTTVEALHPTSWSAAEKNLDPRHEQVTQCATVL